MESEYQRIYDDLKAWWSQFGTLTDAELRNIGSMASEIVRDNARAAGEAFQKDVARLQRLRERLAAGQTYW